MKTFLEFLVEMSLTDAMKLFGLNEVPDSKDELNKHFKKLALKHHPDLGGSEETMKLLNQAKELLDKNLGKRFTSTYSSSSMSSDEKKAWKEEREKQMEYVHNIVEQLFNKFDIKLYKQYLDEAFEINFTMVKKFKEVYNGIKRLEMEFTDAERDKIFQLFFDIDEWAIRRQIFDEKTGLTSPDKTYKINIQSFVYIDGKKQVLVKEKYYNSNDPKIFTDPKILLPKTKISKFAKGEVRKNSKVSKRDFEAMITGKFKGESSFVGSGQSYYYIPVHNEEYIIVLWRNTFMRMGYYNLHAIGKPLDKDKKFMFAKYQKYLEFNELKQKYPGYSSSVHVLENQKGFDFLKDAIANVNKTGNIDKFVKDYIEVSKHIYEE